MPKDPIAQGTMTDADYMRIALSEARLAAAEGEVPVGAVLVRGGAVIAKAHNRVEQTGDPTAHAEMLCLRSAAAAEGAWRMAGCTLYVTLEPCPMCAGAILNARISTVVFGAYDLRAGSFESVVDLSRFPYESRPEVYGGICEETCAALLSDFFRTVRSNEQD